MGLLDKLRASLTGSERDAASQADASNAAAVHSTADVLAVLVGYLVEHAEQELSHDEVDTSANFFDYGYVDSLGIAAFLAFIEERFQVRISDEDLTIELTTLGAVARRVSRGG